MRELPIYARIGKINGPAVYFTFRFFAELLNRRAPGEPVRSYDLRQHLPAPTGATYAAFRGG